MLIDFFINEIIKVLTNFRIYNENCSFNMGIIEMKKIKSAISADGMQNVKKNAFIQSSILFLENEKINIKNQWETLLEQKFQQKIQFIQDKKQEMKIKMNEKVNQLQMKDPDLLDKLQSKNKKSFKEMTGYKKTIEKLESQKLQINKNWNQQTIKLLKDIDDETEAIKQKLHKQIPLTPSLNKLDPQTRKKALNQYIEDDAYEIQRQEYHNRALNLLQQALPFEQILQERFLKKNSNERIQKIVNDFKQNLNTNSFYSSGCGFKW